MKKYENLGMIVMAFWLIVIIVLWVYFIYRFFKGYLDKNIYDLVFFGILLSFSNFQNLGNKK